MKNIYSSTEDYKQRHIYPALGDLGVLYDVDGIAEDMLLWQEVADERTGLIDSNKSGLVEREDVDFWDVVNRHNLTLEELREKTH